MLNPKEEQTIRTRKRMLKFESHLASLKYKMEDELDDKEETEADVDANAETESLDTQLDIKIELEPEYKLQKTE